ncbi:sulfurtransferase-like selenium metabolism protein YedF [Caminibacter sp.]
MRIDCRNLPCPEPVLKTKKALDSMDEGILEVLVNSVSSIQNVKRFATNQGLEAREEKLDNGETLITIIKGYECAIVADEDNKERFLKKVLFIKDDKVGEGELGHILMKGFLKTTLEFDKLPEIVVCVNRGVFLTTKNEETIEILKEVEKRGVKIYSCGVCMNHFKIPPEELKVGEIGNAYDTMDFLLHYETITL